jgi:hypothetical protein
MAHQISTRPRALDASRAAVVLVGAALAVLMALLLTDGGAPAALAITAAAAGFGAFVGACRMLGQA